MAKSPARPKSTARGASKKGSASEPSVTSNKSDDSARESVPLPDALAAAPSEKLAHAIQGHLLSALQAMQRLNEHRPASEQPRWTSQISALQATLQLLHTSFPRDSLSSEAALSEDALDPERTKEFGEKLEQARNAAGLSRQELARRAGISPKTIFNAEAGIIVPTHATLLRLLAVQELGLSSEWVPWQDKGTLGGGSAPNCWIAPGYEPLKMFTALFEILNGRGGSVEQTYAYLDHKSAVNWYQLSNQSQYASMFRARMPLERMARQMTENIGHRRIDMIGLGSGDGKQEVRLVQHLLDDEDSAQDADLRLYLLDISQPLLSAAYQHAAQTLGHHRGVLVQAIQGDFHHWPQYAQFHHTAERAHRRRIVSLIGGSVGNLDNEARFFQHTLIGLAPGDLLLLDVDKIYASPDRPDEIRRKDPAFLKGFPPLHQEWLTGPLRRYIDDAKVVDLQPVLDLSSSVVPGGYTIDALATVKFSDGREKRFSVFRFKRYDLERFAQMMRHLGWELLDEAPFGPDSSHLVGALLLFRRFAASRPVT